MKIDVTYARSEKHPNWEAVRSVFQETRLITVARVLCYAAAIVLMAASTWAVLSARVAVRQASKDESAIAGKVADDTDEAHRLILEAGLTVMEARKASVDERAYLKNLNAQTSATLSNANDLLVSLRTTSDAINQSQTEIAAQTVVAVNSIATATASVNKLVANPDIPKTLAHVDTAAANVEDISNDARVKVYSILHPKAFTKVINAIERVTVDIGRVIF